MADMQYRIERGDINLERAEAIKVIFHTGQVCSSISNRLIQSLRRRCVTSQQIVPSSYNPRKTRYHICTRPDSPTPLQPINPKSPILFFTFPRPFPQLMQDHPPRMNRAMRQNARNRAPFVFPSLLASPPFAHQAEEVASPLATLPIHSVSHPTHQDNHTHRRLPIPFPPVS